MSEIILFCSENAPSDERNDGLDEMKKNPYRFNVRKKLLRSKSRRLHHHEAPAEDMPGGGKKSEF
jgi:hypothetical protein